MYISITCTTDVSNLVRYNKSSKSSFHQLVCFGIRTWVFLISKILTLSIELGILTHSWLKLEKFGESKTKYEKKNQIALMCILFQIISYLKIGKNIKTNIFERFFIFSIDNSRIPLAQLTLTAVGALDRVTSVPAAS